MPKRILIILFCLLGLGLGSSTAGSFLDNPISAKSLALGSCTTTLLDTGAAYKNPASIKLFNQHSIQTMQGQLMNDVKYLDLAYIKPELTEQKFGFGFAFLNTSLTGIEETTYDETDGAVNFTGKKLSYSANAYIFSYAQNLGENIYYGSNLKVIQENLADASSSGAGLDLGFIYRFNENILFGLSAINLVKPELKWTTDASDLVNSRVSLGGSYQYNSVLQFFADAEKIEGRPTYAHFGLEYKPISFFAFRLGYSVDRITIGTGLQYKGFSVDYAYLDNNKDTSLGTTQYIAASLALDFNKAAPAEPDEQKLFAAVSDEQLQKELTQPAEQAPTESAEIMPLPLPEEEMIAEELKPETASPTVAVIEKVEPVLETTSGNEVVVMIEEEYKEPVHDFTIALISVRYYKSSNKLLSKVFVDNTGNQEEEITCSFKLLDAKGNLVKEFEPQKTKFKAKETAVLYFTYLRDSKLPPGVYLIETEIKSATLSKYQKEKFIKR